MYKVKNREKILVFYRKKNSYECKNAKSLKEILNAFFSI